jgi:hypothetical protein
VTSTRATATADLVHVERLRSFVNEGHLYRRGEEHFFVFCGQSGAEWDAAHATLHRSGWVFGETLVCGAPDRRVAVELLSERLGREVGSG